MKVVVELPRSLMRNLEAYSLFFSQSLDETLGQILSDFMFGALELGFSDVLAQSKEGPTPKH
jgi:hypothetical protein